MRKKEEMIVKRKNGALSIKRNVSTKNSCNKFLFSVYIFFFRLYHQKNNYCRFLKQIVQG